MEPSMGSLPIAGLLTSRTRCEPAMDTAVTSSPEPSFPCRLEPIAWAISCVHPLSKRLRDRMLPLEFPAIGVCRVIADLLWVDFSLIRSSRSVLLCRLVAIMRRVLNPFLKVLHLAEAVLSLRRV